METHDQLTIELEQYKLENEKFVGGNKSAGTRLRKAMQEIKNLAQGVRTEVQEIKNGELV